MERVKEKGRRVESEELLFLLVLRTFEIEYSEELEAENQRTCLFPPHHLFSPFGELLGLSMPQFPPLYNGINNVSHRFLKSKKVLMLQKLLTLSPLYQNSIHKLHRLGTLKL